MKHTLLTAQEVPLCVDLDGTLIHTDLLSESFLSALKRQWWIVFLLPFWLLKGRACLKHNLSTRARLDPSSLPYRQDLLARLEREHEQGRTLILATGADRSLAEAVAAHLGIFRSVIATGEGVNLTGSHKADRLTAEFGLGGFDYIGDSDVDIPVWAAARVGTRVSKKSSPLKSLFRALRPKHWVKNLLVFVPVITGHGLTDSTALFKASLAFAAFSLIASSVYLINDLMDLAADRRHPVKYRRPFAAGDLPIHFGLLAAPFLALAGFGIAALLGPASLGVLAFYLGLTFLYTFYLKRKLLVDVFSLAILYTLRIVEGGAATGILCSVWLLAFSVFQFLSLAFLKRSAELSNLLRTSREEASGRNYFTWDLVQVNVFGVVAAYMSSLVLALYIASDNVKLLYNQPVWLWLIVPMHLYWMSRAWILSHRGAMNEDPILFAALDRITWASALVAALVLALASRGGIAIPGVAS